MGLNKININNREIDVIVQNSGQSTTVAMSQKIVTDALNTVVTKNCDISNILEIEHNTISTQNGITMDGYPKRARTVGYIATPFSVTMNSDYKINAVLKYSVDVNGQIAFVASVEVTNPNSISIAEEAGVLYRLTFRKADDTDITDSELLEMLGSFKGFIHSKFDNSRQKEVFFNVNSILGTPIVYYSLSTAINAITEENRRPMMSIVYRTENSKYEYAQYLLSSISDTYFLNSSNWKIVLRTETIDDIAAIKNLNTIINVQIYNNTTSGYSSIIDAATTIASADRRIGCILIYRDASNLSVWHKYQFKVSQVSDTYWLDGSQWIDLDYKPQPFINVSKYTNSGSGVLFTLATATAAIASVDRMPGQILLIKYDSQDWRLFKFKGGTNDDYYYLDERFWDDITNNYLRFSCYGGISRETGKRLLGNGYYCTPYIGVKPGIVIRGYEGSNVAMITFFDRFFNYISSYPLEFGHQYQITLTAQDIPANAFYLRASGQINVEQGYITGYGGTGIDDEFIDYWMNEPLQQFSRFLTYKNMYPLGNLSVGDTVSMTSNSQTHCVAIPCNEGDKFLITGKGGIGPRLWGWCDADMKLISCSEQSLSAIDLQVTAPTNAKFFIYNNIFAECYPSVCKVNKSSSTPTPTDEVPKAVWMALGDSITQGYYSDNIEPYYHLDASKGWTNWVRRITGKTLINKAIGGTGFACKGPRGDSACGRELVDQLIAQNAFNGIDLVTIAYGVNDWKYNYVLGNMTDVVDASATNIIPSMRYVIERIMYANPNIKIIGIMPINCKFGTEANNWGIGYPFSHNGTLEQIYTAFKEVYEYYGIEYIDMLHASVINRKNIGQMLLDNVHPSIPAHQLLGRELAMKINCY